MDDLGTMSVGFGGNLAGLDEAVQAAIDKLNNFAAAAAKIGNISVNLDTGGVAAGVDAADSELAQLEAQIADAKASLAAMLQSPSGADSSGIEELQGQIANMEAQAEQARGSLAELQTQEQETGNTAEASGAKTHSAFSGFSLSGMVQNIGMTIFGFQNMANMATQMAGALLQPAMNAENMQASFTNLTGSASLASAELQKLDDFAAHTQFTTMDIDQAGAQLLGFGFKAQDIIPDIQAIGDNLSAVGKGTPAEVQSVVDILGKMSTQGKITQMDINELGTHGIKALQDIAAGAGVSTTEIQKMIANGTLPANQAIADLTKGIEANPLYAGGMAKQSSTLSGIMSTLSSDWDVFMSKIMSPALPALEGGLSKLTATLTNPSFQKFATEVGVNIVGGLTALGGGFSKLVGIGSQVVTFFQNNEAALTALKTVGIAAAGAIAATMVVAFYNWAAAAAVAAATTLAATWPILAVGAVVALVVAGIVLAITHWGQIVDWLKGVWGVVANWFQDRVILPIQISFKIFSAFFEGIWNGMGNVVKGGINGIISGINSFIGFIDSIQIHIPSVGVGPIHSPAFDWNGLGIAKIPLLASGGQVGAGAFIAGESGPELVYTSGATVYNRGQTAAMMDGGRETHVHIHLGTQEVAHILVDAVGQKIVKKLLSQGPVRSVA